MNRIGFILSSLLVLLALASSTLFVVDQRQFGVVYALGQIKDVITEPGLNFKLPPPFQNVSYIDKRLLTLDSTDAEPMLTAEKQRVVIDWYVRWRITEPTEYIRNVGLNESAGASQLNRVVRNAFQEEINRRTVRELLSHTSGIPPEGSDSGTGRDLYADEFQNKILSDLSHVYTMDDIVEYVRDRPLLFPPGTSTGYSNINTILLGQIVASITGKSLGASLHALDALLGLLRAQIEALHNGLFRLLGGHSQSNDAGGDDFKHGRLLIADDESAIEIGRAHV